MSYKANLTERIGIKYFKRYAGEFSTASKRMGPAERAKIRKTVQKALRNAVFAGISSSGIAVFFAYGIRGRVSVFSDFFLEENINLLLIFAGLTLLVSLAEMIWLSHDILQKSKELVKASGKALFPPDDSDMQFARTIVRAALEIPNPQNGHSGIKPLKESSKFRSIILRFLYKAKASLSKVIFKSLVQRAVGKTLSRFYFTMLSVPLVAFWNGFEAWKIMSELRVRILGPKATREIAGKIRSQLADASEDAKYQSLQAIAVNIFAAENLHPNLKNLYAEIKNDFAQEINPENFSSENFYRELEKIKPEKRRPIVMTAEFSLVLSGSLKYRQRKMMRKIYKIAHMEPSLKKIRSMRRKLKQASALYPGFSYD